jgi:hypothetical protein
MRKILIATFLILVLTSSGNAQLWKMRRYEVSAGIGTTQFFGDIGGYSQGENILGLKDISFNQTRLNINTAFKYRILNDVTVRLNMSFGSFHSTDEKGSNEDRGFESKTMFFEPAIIGEYYFIRNKGDNSFLLMKGSSYPFRKRFFPMLDCYVFTGFGGLSYNVKPNDKLEPFVTETGGFTPVIPVGLGANLTYSGTYNFGIELGARYTFSDNIDGYTSAYSKSNDMYYMLNFTFTYKIRTKENGLPTFKMMGRR